MQEAVDKVGHMLDDCYQRWHDAIREMPKWDEHVAKQVSRLLEGYRDVGLGTLYWR